METRILFLIAWIILVACALKLFQEMISWKTKRIRSLVYAGVVKEYRKRDPSFKETEDFKRYFKKMFRGYNIITDHGLNPTEVELFYLDSIVYDLYRVTGGH